MSEWNGKVAIVTGAARGIGACIAEAFRKVGVTVYTIDVQGEVDFIGDLAKPADIEAFAQFVLQKHEYVDYLIHNAAPLMKGIDTASYDEFQYALQVGVTAPFYLTKLLKDYLGHQASIIMMSSTRDRMSQAQTESYAASKGGIAALTHALAVSLAGKARVNSISPGWIETNPATIHQATDLQQHPARRIGKPEDIAEMVLFLCSSKASFITGENITIDGGMTKMMIYHDDAGWRYEPGEV